LEVVNKVLKDLKDENIILENKINELKKETQYL
jgi:cell division protein FtsB